MKKHKKPLIFAILGTGMVVGAAILGRRRKLEEKTQFPMPVPVMKLEEELKNRLGEFLAQDRFSIVIQPVVDFRDNSVSNGEALARLNHPELGVIFPDSFLPTVDALGLYPRFDRYIFCKCCAWMRNTRSEGESFHSLSCNFSRKTLSEKTIVQDMVEIADRYGVPHSTLAIEITERERETDALQFLENLKALKAAGFRVYLDDYGNGVTTAGELMRYPLDVVKIDRSLLLKAESGQGAESFRALVATAAGIGVKIVCEGIETEAQDRFAREAGCHYGQGFLYFKPFDQNRGFEMMQKANILEYGE